LDERAAFEAVKKVYLDLNESNADEEPTAMAGAEVAAAAAVSDAPTGAAS
jgi:hypothetical protein